LRRRRHADARTDLDAGTDTNSPADAGADSRTHGDSNTGAYAEAQPVPEELADRVADAVRNHRGIALITVLLVIAVMVAILAVVVAVGTIQLRRSVEELHALQAQAGADAGIGWVRALLYNRQGDIALTLGDLAAARSATTLTLDDTTSVLISVSTQIAAPAAAYDHQDIALQQNPYVVETPLQVTSTAVVNVQGAPVAARSTTALIRVFHEAAPYSEVVGVVDNAGPVGIDSPGDPAGQAASANATDLRIHAYQQAGTQPVSADTYSNQTWSDGNQIPSGALP
jgi:hypothetical protein